MLDIKEMDEDEHKQLTGQTNKNILDMATCLSDHGKAMWIRHVLVPGITDDDGQLHRLRAFIDTLKPWNVWKFCHITRWGYLNGKNLGFLCTGRCGAADQRAGGTCTGNYYSRL